MKDFTEIRKGYFRGKMDGIRAERVRTGLFLDKALKRELDIMSSLLANGEMEHEFGKLLDRRLKNLRTRILDYRKTVMAHEDNESLHEFARKMNNLNAGKDMEGFRVFVEGRENNSGQLYAPGIKYLISRTILEYPRVSEDRHDLSIVLGNEGCKLIFVYPGEFELAYPHFRSQILEISSMIDLKEQAITEWKKFVLWQLSF